jgi:hypothetical protein
MMDYDEYGAVGGMNAEVPLYPPQIPHDLTWARIRVAAVWSQRLTAWASARSDNLVLVVLVVVREYFFQFQFRGSSCNIILTESVKLGMENYDLRITQYYKYGGRKISEIISRTFNVYGIFTYDLSEIHTTTTTKTNKTTKTTDANNDFATRRNKSKIRPTKP